MQRSQQLSINNVTLTEQMAHRPMLLFVRCVHGQSSEQEAQPEQKAEDDPKASSNRSGLLSLDLTVAVAPAIRV